MNELDARAFCENWLPLWTGNRPDALLACYRDDALYRDPARPDGLRGTHEIAAYFRPLLAANPEWRWEPVEVIGTAAGFVLKWRATVPVGATVVVEEGLDIVEVDGAGRISRNEVFFDRTALREAFAIVRSRGTRAWGAVP